MYAESQKVSGADLDIPKRMILEVYIPTLSVFSLISVTIWIAYDSIIELTSSNNDDDNVDLIFLYCFSGINFVIDIISSGLFYIKGKDVLFYMSRKRFSSGSSNSSITSQSPTNPKLTNHDPEETHYDDDGISNSSPLDPKTNVNMVSALTHVGADTLRSISVFVAALISTIGGYSSTLCDAWASVVVILTIFIALVPLINEIYKAYTLLK